MNKIGWCVEAHDLAASKLIAFRDKDREFVRKLLVEKMIKPTILINRIKSITEHDDLKDRALGWANKIVAEL